MISALVSGYKAVFEQPYLEKAKSAAHFLLSNLVSDNRVLRTYGNGKAKLKGYLDDYSYLVKALLDLKEVDSNPLWLDTAVQLTDTMLEFFWDETNGGFFYTASDHEKLVIRTKSHFDGAVPSGASVAVSNLLRLHKITDNQLYLDRANTVIEIYSELMEKRPEQFGNLLSCLVNRSVTGKEIVLVEDSAKEIGTDLLKAIYKEYRPRDIVVVHDIESTHKSEIRLLEERKLLNNAPTVYVCENFTCKEPTSDVEKLLSVL